MAELDATGAVITRYVYASRENVPDYMVKNGRTYRIITDWRGSVRLVIDTQDGTVVQRMRYDAFGKLLEDTSPGFQMFGFAGGLTDGTTGVVRFGARDYDPRVGRWTAKDPIGVAGGVNLYDYVRGDPVNRVDPTGLWGVGVTITEQTDIGIGGVGAGQSGSVGLAAFPQTSRVTPFYSAGGFAGTTSGRGVAWPCPPARANPNLAVGGYAGVGGNAFFTNARNFSDFAGPFRVMSLNIGAGIRGISLQVATDADGTIVVSYGGLTPIPYSTGVGFGVGLSIYNTMTGGW